MMTAGRRAREETERNSEQEPVARAEGALRPGRRCAPDAMNKLISGDFVKAAAGGVVMASLRCRSALQSSSRLRGHLSMLVSDGCRRFRKVQGQGEGHQRGAGLR